VKVQPLAKELCGNQFNHVDVTGQVWDQHGARDGLVIDRDGREEGACSSEGHAVAEEASDPVEREGGGVHVFCRLADHVVHVQRVQAGKLPQGRCIRRGRFLGRSR